MLAELNDIEISKPGFDTMTQAMDIMHTGYWVADGHIWGPRCPGLFWIDGSVIKGPFHSGQYQILDGRIYGPNCNGDYCVKRLRRNNTTYNLANVAIMAFLCILFITA